MRIQPGANGPAAVIRTLDLVRGISDVQGGPHRTRPEARRRRGRAMPAASLISARYFAAASASFLSRIAMCCSMISGPAMSPWPGTTFSISSFLSISMSIP